MTFLEKPDARFGSKPVHPRGGPVRLHKTRWISLRAQGLHFCADDLKTGSSFFSPLISELYKAKIIVEKLFTVYDGQTQGMATESITTKGNFLVLGINLENHEETHTAINLSFRSIQRPWCCYIAK